MTSWISLPTEEAFITLRALGRVALTASLNERVEDGLEQRREEGAMMMRRVRDLKDSLANEQEAHL